MGTISIRQTLLLFTQITFLCHDINSLMKLGNANYELKENFTLIHEI